MKASVVKRELPSIFCVRCRRWVESQEKVNLFATVDGVPRRVMAWVCPECRGEVPKGAAVEAREVTQADVSRDERLGPYRQVVDGTEVVNQSGKTARVDLTCGHNACVIPGARKARCRKCLKPKPGLPAVRAGAPTSPEPRSVGRICRECKATRHGGCRGECNCVDSYHNPIAEDLEK